MKKIFLILLITFVSLRFEPLVTAKEKIIPSSEKERIYYNPYFKTKEFQSDFKGFLKTLPLITKNSEAIKIARKDPHVLSILNEGLPYYLFPASEQIYTEDEGKTWHGLVIAVGKFTWGNHAIRQDYFFEVDPVTKKVRQIDGPVTYIEFDED